MIMQGHLEIINKLNAILADELTAVSQYMVQSVTCDLWGYKRLADAIEARAKMEMGHAEKLIDRIVFLEGMPIVWNLLDFTIGSSVEEFNRNDRDKEIVAILGYQSGIKLATDLNDAGTEELFEANLQDEEMHLMWIEAQIAQMEQMGISNYLSAQIS
jgi:bacterioferritin